MEGWGLTLVAYEKVGYIRVIKLTLFGVALISVKLHSKEKIPAVKIIKKKLYRIIQADC